MYIINLFF
ncbi:hypothetical protein LINPERPRIM_LOCUS10996 [Linum perenne]